MAADASMRAISAGDLIMRQALTNASPEMIGRLKPVTLLTWSTMKWRVVCSTASGWPAGRSAQALAISSKGLWSSCQGRTSAAIVRLSSTEGTSKNGVTTTVWPEAGISAAVVRSERHQRMPVKYSSDEPASMRQAATARSRISDCSLAMRLSRSAAVIGCAFAAAFAPSPAACAAVTAVRPVSSAPAMVALRKSRRLSFVIRLAYRELRVARHADAALVDRDDHFATCPSRLEIAHGLPDFSEGIGPVDHRHDLDFLHEPPEYREVLAAVMRDEHDEVLVHEPGDYERPDGRHECTEPGIRVGAAAADQDELAVGRQHAAYLEHAAVGDIVHDDVVLPATLREVFPGVVDDVIRAERPDQLDVAGTGHARHLGTQ